MSKFTAPKPAAAKPRVQRVKPTVIEADVVEPKTEASSETMFERMRAAADDYFASLGEPSWKRRAVALCLSVLSYATTFYGAMQLVDVLCMGVIMHSGVGFISFLVAFIGILAALVAAISVSRFVYDAAMTFEFSNVKSRVTSWFGAANKEPSHA